MKKICLCLIMCLLCVTLTGCDNNKDHITVWNKSDWIFDDVDIDMKDGYFYSRHEKFKVDENTVGVTIYFTNEKVDEFESED